jgi:hypothetical protein
MPFAIEELLDEIEDEIRFWCECVSRLEPRLPAPTAFESEIACIHAGLRTVPQSTIHCLKSFVNGI